MRKKQERGTSGKSEKKRKGKKKNREKGELGERRKNLEPRGRVIRASGSGERLRKKQEVVSGREGEKREKRVSGSRK